MSQLNSVFQPPQLEQPDWALQVLQHLLNIYSSLQNNLTLPNDKNTTFNKYEFIAIINACLEQITAIKTFDNYNSELAKEIAIIQNLQQEFTTQVTSLERFIDSLEAPATKFKGEYFY